MAETKKMKSEASTSGGSIGGESVVMDVGRRKSTCGYCKSGARTSISHGLWANSLTVDHYQALLDRGWRRSGCFLYKPEMERTCCPSYTIRLKASNFIPSKEQVRVSKRVQRFVEGTLDMKEDNLINELNTSGGSSINALNSTTSSAMESSQVACENKDKTNQLLQSISDQVNQMIQLCLKSGELPSDIEWPKASIRKVEPTKRKLQAEVSEVLLYSCNIAFQIAATLRRTQKNAELGVGRNGNLVEISAEKIAEILTSSSNKNSEPHGFSIRACKGHINFYFSGQQVGLLEEAGRHMIKKSSTSEKRGNEKCSMKMSQGVQSQKRRFEIRLKQSSFDSEEYALYRKYQLQVHNDTPEHVTESSYMRFLVDSPLIHVSPNGDLAAPPCGFGSFHQQYVVDGKLIAVGVIDILPKCLSSKYLFWDPDYAALSLGKFSALEEIKWVRENNVHCPSLQYYYLGYYIHSCRKMRYKAAYRPSELLCPLRYQWVPYDISKKLLDRDTYAVLSDFNSLENGILETIDAVDNNMEEPQHEFMLESSNDVFINSGEMSQEEDEDSDNESDLESSVSNTLEMEDADLSNVLIGLKQGNLRYQDLSHAFDSYQRSLFESQLRKYTKVVGTELSEQMVYSLV